MYIKRHILNLIAKLEKMYGVILITGARRTGKTTFLENYKSKLKLLNFDDATLRETIKVSPNLFFKDHKLPLILDEVQRVPELFLQLKRTYNEYKSFFICLYCV